MKERERYDQTFNNQEINNQEPIEQSSNLPDWEVLLPSHNNPMYNEELFEREYEAFIKNKELCEEFSSFIFNK